MEKEWLKWQKMDLHIHTKKTTRDEANKNFVSISEENVKDFVDTIIKNDVKLIAITNHNEIFYDQYKMIKKEANKKNLEVILGVEINGEWETKNKESKNFHFNLLLEEEYLAENTKKINEQLKNLNIKNNKYFEKNALNKKEIINLISSLRGRVIMCLDYGKKSSKVSKINFLDDFWFYFDIYEGNNKNNIKDIQNKIDKIAKNKNINFKFSPPLFFGTDNRNFYEYPSNGSRKGWTGTFFLCQPSFNGLLSAIDFNFLVKMKTYNEDLNNVPTTDDLELKYLDFSYKNSEIQKIYFDRGVNIILGRRGSGKTILLTEITKALEKKNITFFKLKQNQITSIIENGFNNQSIFENENNIAIEYENIFKNFKNKIYKNKYIENINFKEININFLYKNFFELIKAEKENIKISKEDKVINELNRYFAFFKKDKKLSKDLHELHESFVDIKQNLILKTFIKNLNIELAKKELNILFKKELSKININFQQNALVKKDNKIINNEINNWILDTKNQINKRKEIFLFIIEEIKNIFQKLQSKYYYRNKKIKILTIEILFLFNKNIDIYINEIGKHNKIKHFFTLLKNFYESFFWKNNFVEKYSKKGNYETALQDFKIVKKMNNIDVTSLSPGQMVELYIKNIFLNNAYKVFLIDQPEDQLDAITVSETIINPIQKQYPTFIEKGVQLIFVTHDPKIAINLGPTNIIECIENTTGVYNKKNLGFIDIYKKENDFVKKVDGRKEYVHKRSEIYGKRN